MKFTLILSLVIFLQSFAFAEFPEGGSPSTGMGGGMFGFFNVKPAAEELKQTIKVKLGNKKTVSCDLDNASKAYMCGDEKNPVLIKKAGFDFFAIGMDEKSQPKILNVTNVEANGKVVYSSRESEFSAADTAKKPDLTKDLSKTFFEKVLLIDNFFKSYKNEKGKLVTVRLKGSEKFEKIAQQFYDQQQQFQQEIKNAFGASDYSIELQDGTRIKCVRGKSNPLSDDLKDLQILTGNKIQCGAFKCEPVIVDGKTYDASLIYESSPASMTAGSVFLTDKDGGGPKVSIKKISSELSETPLVDNSYLLENGNTTYYGNYMSSMIPASITDPEERDRIAFYKDPNLSMLLAYNNGLCEDKESIEKILSAKMKAVKKLADLELAEFIQVLANGSLVGIYVDPSMAPSLGCLYQGVYLNSEAAKNLERLKKNIHPDRHVDQTITSSRAKELFTKAAAMKDIAWKYKPDGCYARAHLMARRFEAEGVRVDKVWIKGELYVPGTPIQWNFHVAPIVYVEDEKGKVQKMVIDPSLFDKPVTVEEWDRKMAKKTINGSVVTAFPFPENSGFMERSTLSFSSSDPYLPRDSIDVTEDQKMRQADATMKMYKAMEPK